MRFCDGAKERAKPKEAKPQDPPSQTEGGGTLRVTASRSDIAVCARGSILLKGKNPQVVRATRLDTFYSELQTPSRIQANTPTPQVEETEEDFKSELTQS